MLCILISSTSEAMVVQHAGGHSHEKNSIVLKKRVLKY